MRKPTQVLLAITLLLALQGCASVRAAAWELRKERTPLPVRGAASLGETIGFVALAPVSILLLPVLVPVVHIVDIGDPYEVLFFPSIAGGDLGSVVLGGITRIAVSPFLGSEEPEKESGGDSRPRDPPRR